MNTDPPKTNYKTIPLPLPDSKQDSLYNGQICICGHDRLCHTGFLGEGKKRVLILNCQYAGNCFKCSNCCSRFVFSHRLSSLHGKKMYAEECKKNKIRPPQTKPEG